MKIPQAIEKQSPANIEYESPVEITHANTHCIIKLKKLYCHGVTVFNGKDTHNGIQYLQNVKQVEIIFDVKGIRIVNGVWRPIIVARQALIFEFNKDKTTTNRGGTEPRRKRRRRNLKQMTLTKYLRIQEKKKKREIETNDF